MSANLPSRENWRQRQQAIVALDMPVETLISYLADENFAVRTVAVQKLASLGTVAVNPLLMALNHRDVLIRAGTARVLGILKDGRAVTPLVNALHDEDTRVQRAAIEALGLFRTRLAVQPLIECLRTSQDDRVVTGCAVALGRIGDARAVEPLIALLRQPHLRAVMEAARSLAQLGDPRAIEPLIDVLRRYIVEKTAYIHDEYERLQILLHQSAMHGQAHGDVPEFITAMLVRFGEAAVGPLAQALDDPLPALRMYAEVTLGQLGH